MNEAKKKAEELVERFRSHHVITRRNTKGTPVNPYVSLEMQKSVIDIQAQEFALICVDEILEATKKKELRRITSSNPTYKYVYSVFWQQVKQEINNLTK